MFCESGSDYYFGIKMNEMSIINSSKEPSQNYMSYHGNENLTLQTSWFLESIDAYMLLKESEKVSEIFHHIASQRQKKITICQRF